VSGSALARQEGKRAVPRRFVLPVTHLDPVVVSRRSGE
jgi:hypothetical protein